METLERILELNSQCFSVGADFSNGVLLSHESQVIRSSSTERKNTHEVLSESSACLDSLSKEEPCIIEMSILKRENEPDEAWIENDEGLWTGAF
ncbi:hypothetical protein SUGI_0708760 [Cryptomeria japonica]|nr:hypothetical protein SUGI_0708760 [Cryptomeria japonica]